MTTQGPSTSQCTSWSSEHSNPTCTAFILPHSLITCFTSWSAWCCYNVNPHKSSYFTERRELLAHDMNIHRIGLYASVYPLSITWTKHTNLSDFLDSLHLHHSFADSRGNVIHRLRVFLPIIPPSSLYRVADGRDSAHDLSHVLHFLLNHTLHQVLDLLGVLHVGSGVHV